MKELLNVAVCQCGVVWENPDENRLRLKSFIDSYLRRCREDTHPDLIVLPEFFCTGFTSNTAMAEDPDGPTMRWMQALAGSSGAAVTGSVPVRTGERVVNRMYFICPDGRTESYDKRHLFRMSGENEVFASGSTRRTVEYLGWRICLNICYDLRFPVWSRRTAECDYDVLLNVASWPSSRMTAASILVHARAVENQAWTIFCNRVGESPENSYCGGSLIVDYKGRSVGIFHPDDATGCGGGFLQAGLDIHELRRFREKFPAWMDSDEFLLK